MAPRTEPRAPGRRARTAARLLTALAAPAALTLGAGLTSCIYYPALPDYSNKDDESPSPPVEPTRYSRSTRWADGSPRARYDILVWPDGRQERHGSFLETWPDGTLRADRNYAEGVPIGTWRSWHADGSRRSEETFPGGGAEGHARWWHTNGLLSAEGSTVEGAREGLWRFWDEAGVELEVVVYADGVPASPAPPQAER